MSRYDARTTTFSPEGRLFQVEYAMEAISHAGTAIGILAKDGVMLAAEKKITSKLLDTRHTHEKIFTISDDIICAVAGITSDANILIDYARLTCQRYLYNYHEPIPVEQLVQAICNLKQSYTQNGGMRPFGASFLWAGWDKVYGFQLYQSDPSGNYGGWKATCIGANNTTAQSIFKTDYEGDELTLDGARKLLVKVLGKTVESATIVGEKLEYAVLSRENEKVSLQLYTAAQIDSMVKEVQSSMEGRVRTKTVKKASRVFIEKYYPRLTLDFQTNKRLAAEVAIIPSKRLRNKIAGFTTHLMRRIQKGPVRGISFKLQEEERERKDNYVPAESALKLSSIQVDPETKALLDSMDMPKLPGVVTCDLVAEAPVREKRERRPRN